MSIAPQIHESRVVLHGVSWSTYQRLRAAGRNDGLRMTYDRGELEIMSPSRKHETISHRLALMIYEWTMHRGIAIEFGGSTTLSREDLKRGLESDHCFWIAKCAAVVDKDEIDLSIDPAPDLALEVDVSRLSTSKLPIYQAIGVPEVWRWRGSRLEVLVLNSLGQYVTQPRSGVLAGFPITLAQEFVQSRGEDNMALMRRFRKAITGKRRR